MANNKNKIKELVSDDEDPTAELEALALDTFNDDELEADANTFNFIDERVDEADAAAISELKTDLRIRSETITRLQFDIEQLRSKWLGLEAEIKAREEATRNLQADLSKQQETIARKNSLLKKRDRRIRALKSEIRDRETEYRNLTDSADTIAAKLAEHEEALSTGRVASDATEVRELREQLARTEQYADSIRQQLSDVLTSNEDVEELRRKMQSSVDDANERVDELTGILEETASRVSELIVRLESSETTHEEEIRTLRFELGEAQDTLTNSETMNENLAIDLVSAQSHKEELERMLEQHDSMSAERIRELENEVERLAAESLDYSKKLDAKSEAINCLLAEISRKSEQIDSINEIEEVIHDIDDRMSESIDAPSTGARDRVTRLLIGSVDDQVLRFPLFKDRLTIGRTSSNDIQLKAQYISRRHAVVLTEGDTTRVIDWGSKNGVFVNSKRVTEHFLKNGDIVTIGTADFRYEERAKRD
jgi:chromosome segregation ATPase